MLRGFGNFLMRGDVIVVAVGLVVALAFSGLISAFTEFLINPIIARAQGGHAIGLGVQLGKAGNTKTFLDFVSFISALIYFLIFMAVVYFVIVVPYKHLQARRGRTVFGDPAPTKTCPACLSDDLHPAATRCKYCGFDQPMPPNRLVRLIRTDPGPLTSAGSGDRAAHNLVKISTLAA